MRIRHALAVLTVVPFAAVMTTGAAQKPAATQKAAAPITFTEQIAPLVYANCVTCHRAGEVAPFPLVTYEDVATRAKQIARVTGERIMPPWHAEPGYGEFLDERRLTDAQIETIRAWVSAGMPRGPVDKMPPLPAFADGWQLGTPDLVVEMPEAFEVPASGPDVYRNFVIPANLPEEKWVKAIEFRPGSRPVVHHALIGFIRAGSAEGIAAKDGKPGFGGPMPITFVPAFAPAGELDGWAVGQSPHVLPLGLAKRLPKESDLVVQLHLHPSGKPERERSKVGLYFSSTPPTRRILEPTVPGLFGLQAGIDIPAGEKAFTVKGVFTFPRDMLLVSAMAHAHYLGKEFKAIATLPDGSTKPLLWIKDWDFNWQDRYYYKEPVAMPKGTRIDVTIVYDNSAENPHNPCTPPQRVQWGLQSTDEMGGIRLQVVPAEENAPPPGPEFAAAVRAALQNAAQSEAAKNAAQRFAEQQKRFREGLIAPGGCEAGNRDRDRNP